MGRIIVPGRSQEAIRKETGEQEEMNRGRKELYPSTPNAEIQGKGIRRRGQEREEVDSNGTGENERRGSRRLWHKPTLLVSSCILPQVAPPPDPALSTAGNQSRFNHICSVKRRSSLPGDTLASCYSTLAVLGLLPSLNTVAWLVSRKRH